MPPKKIFHESEEKMHTRNEDDLVESEKLGTGATTSWCFFLQKDIFHILIHIADMAIQMSNIHNFDMDKMSSKFTQR